MYARTWSRHRCRLLLAACSIWVMWAVVWPIFLAITRPYQSDLLSEIIINTRDNDGGTRVHTLVRGRPSSLIHVVNESSRPPVNPHDFRLVINEPDRCKHDDGSNRDVFLLVLVATLHINADLRQTVRETWASLGVVDGMNVVTMFLLGKSRSSRFDRTVEAESAKHHDILMEDFLESYQNLTRKTIMGMKWAATYCPQAKYVMKTDDDMFVMYENIVRHLASPEIPSTNFGTGLVIRASPARDTHSKWHMPESTYTSDWYPPFFSGSGYILSNDVAKNVVSVSRRTPFLHLEDVYVGVCLFELDVKLTHHREFHNHPHFYSYCLFQRLFTTHYDQVLNPQKRDIWKKIRTAEGETNCYLHFW